MNINLEGFGVSITGDNTLRLNAHLKGRDGCQKAEGSTNVLIDVGYNKNSSSFTFASHSANANVEGKVKGGLRCIFVKIASFLPFIKKRVEKLEREAEQKLRASLNDRNFGDVGGLAVARATKILGKLKSTMYVCTGCFTKCTQNSNFSAMTFPRISIIVNSISKCKENLHKLSILLRYLITKVKFFFSFK